MEAKRLMELLQLRLIQHKRETLHANGTVVKATVVEQVEEPDEE